MGKLLYMYWITHDVCSTNQMTRICVCDKTEHYCTLHAFNGIYMTHKDTDG